MSHLVRALKGAEISQLRRIYSILAEAYLEHRAGRDAHSDHSSPADYHSLRNRVLSSESAISLSAYRHACDFITAEQERPIEVFNNLGQMEVLVAAIDILHDTGRIPDRCAPTQQSKDDDYQDIPDLAGPDWSLEAFGGHNYGNNKKLIEDLCSLYQRYTSGDTVFLAFRDAAWTAYRSTKLIPGEPLRVKGTTAKSRVEFGRTRVRCTAQLRPIENRDSIWVCQVLNLSCDPPRIRT